MNIGRKLMVASFLLFSSNAFGLTKIGIIDTGLSKNYDLKLCKTGHYNFVENRTEVGDDDIGHGTAIAQGITQHIMHDDYCIIIYKVIAKYQYHESVVSRITRALRKAIDDGVDVLNISISGDGLDANEEEVLEEAALHNIKMFVAAGNDNLRLDKDCKISYACFKKRGLDITVVGALNPDGNIRDTSNYGAYVDVYEDGEVAGIAGTSASTAIATGKWVNGQSKHY